MKLTHMLLAAAAAATPAAAEQTFGMDPRPAYLVSQMDESPLQERLEACIGQPIRRTDFSIGHRGAPLMFPEHTIESNVAAAAMGAGVLECDVTFTRDKELVCRHAQNDLHTTTNILATDLAANCTAPFSAAAGETPAKAECRTSDLTLAEFRTLKPKMDDRTAGAATAEDYMKSANRWRTDLYATNATLMTHAESIALFKSLGTKFTPELKDPAVEMPFDGFTMDDYAQKMIDEYKAAGVAPAEVFPQSFNLSVVRYWVKNEPEFGKQAVYLIDDSSIEDLDGMNPATWGFTPADLKAEGVNYVAPAIPFLITLNDKGEIVPSELAKQLKAADINIITWTLERSGPLASGSGWYYHTVKDAIDRDGDYFEVLDVLAQDVGVKGVFSDWPVTVSFYASCMGLN